MSAPLRVTNEQIVVAYQRTGSVWKAARELGIVGQSVWERLRALGHPIAGARWTAEEIDEARALVGVVSVGEIAQRLGRPYAAVACKLSELGISAARPRERKVPRGKGLTKATTRKLILAAASDPRPITKFCRARGFNVDTFVLAAQKYAPELWREYMTAHSPLPERKCEYCDGAFIPASGKQRTCSRKCQRDARADRTYFGGKRRTTVGLAEGVCQLCERANVKGLSSHHVLGKENDPDNDYLIALCRGCHQLVGMLGRMALSLTEEGWQNLISLAVVRKLADVKDHRMGVHVAVDLEWLTRADLIDQGLIEEVEPERPT